MQNKEGLNKFGRESVLSVKTKLSGNITIVEDSYFTAPLKIAKPFYDYQNNMANIMLMTASAGIMEGDFYNINMEIGTGTAAALQGQSYTKIHDMNLGCAGQQNFFHVGENAFFDYDPKPAIPFSGSHFTSNTVCRMEKNSQYIFSEILSCGREKSGEQFGFRYYKACSRVYYCNKLIFNDNQVLIPNIQKLMGIGFFEKYTHQATLAYFSENMNSSLEDRLYSILEQFSGIEAGISSAYKYGIVIRILGLGSDYLEKIIGSLRKEIYSCSSKLYSINEGNV